MVMSMLVFGCDLLGSASPARERSCFYGYAYLEESSLSFLLFAVADLCRPGFYPQSLVRPIAVAGSVM